MAESRKGDLAPSADVARNLHGIRLRVRKEG